MLDMVVEEDSINYFDIFKKNKKILIIGPLPPPLGGVSVHISRLIALLKEQQYSVKCFNTSKKQNFKILKYFKLVFDLIANKYGTIHIHENDLKIFRILLIFPSKFIISNFSEFSRASAS